MTHITVELSEPGYYVSVFTVKAVQSERGVAFPAVGGKVCANDLFTCVVNGWTVTIEPRRDGERY